MDFAAVFPALVGGRLLLAISPLPGLLKDHHILSSPLTAYSRLQEGLALYRHGIDPYSGGPFHHSPLYLALFSTIIPSWEWVHPIIWTLSDALGAFALVRIWRVRQGVTKSSRDLLIAASYLFNPYIFLSTLALSTSTFENTLILLSIMLASEGFASSPLALLTLALATCLSLPSAYLLPPILLLIETKPTSTLASPRLHPLVTDFRSTAPHIIRNFVICGFHLAALFVASSLVIDGWSLNWMKRTWGIGLTLTDLTPNVGLWWYFFTEMFDHFRPFFLMVFSVHLFIYVPPLCIKFQHDPLYASFLVLGVLGMFKPYPTLADPGLFLSMFSVFPEVYPYLRHPLPTALVHLHAALLLPLFHALWLISGTGNANFFYAITLVFGAANGAALIDATWAGLRIAIGKGSSGQDLEVLQE